MNDKATKIGLFLGKYSILHSGHQFVIDTALKEMDKLIILIYDAPSSTAIPLDVRAVWMEKIYANLPVEVVKGWCGPEDTGYSDEIKSIQNEYILTMVGDRGITHFYSSEPYGEHVSESSHCVNMTVDLERKNPPIAASTIQKNPYLYYIFFWR
ncbi:adenylyltransferase/cytidyltransferase family protein [Bacillaceae bacterium Marseille-Q3522]|nr:adenylyltransferase/cytidyltransferase family protein [Bacillaceae bacterium Marseille-Q3522]